MICFVFEFILHYVFVLHLCVVARIRPSQSLIYIYIYHVRRRQKRRRRRFRASSSTFIFIWISLLRIDLKAVGNNSAKFGRILFWKDGATNVWCTLRMRFCASYISSFKTLFCILVYIMLSFVRIWVGMGVVRHPASYPMGTRDSFPGVKRPGREADHSPPSSAEVKNAWSYTSIPQYVFMAWCSVKHRDNFTFYLFTSL
jgi:hypothetical protein